MTDRVGQEWHRSAIVKGITYSQETELGKLPGEGTERLPLSLDRWAEVDS